MTYERPVVAVRRSSLKALRIDWITGLQPPRRHLYYVCGPSGTGCLRP